MNSQDESDTQVRKRFPGYDFSRDLTWHAKAIAAEVDDECDCTTTDGKKVTKGLLLVIGHRFSSDQTAKVTVSAGLSAEKGGHNGEMKVGGQIGASIEFAPSQEGSWVKTYKVICPTGGVNDKPITKQLKISKSRSVHPYHKHGGEKWSGFSGASQ